MPQMLKLDNLITILACLTTTQDNELTSITKNSMEPLQIDNTTGGCPLSTLSAITTRIQNIAIEIRDIKDQLAGLEEQMIDMKRNGGVGGFRSGDGGGVAAIRPYAIQPTFESRFLSSPSDIYVPPPTSNIPTSCWDQKHGTVRIKPSPDIDPFPVFCDQESRGGGWIRIANRFEGTINFYQTWREYKNGFGSVNTELFIGLEKVHAITGSANCELMVIMEDRKQEERYAVYDQFSIGNENEKYVLNVLGTYVGDAGDALRYHSGKKFSTHDQDNDESTENCAEKQSGAWWYGESCDQSNLFGVFQPLLQRDIDNYKGILWKTFLEGPKGSLKIMKMFLRPKRN